MLLFTGPGITTFLSNFLTFSFIFHRLSEVIKFVHCPKRPLKTFLTFEQMCVAVPLRKLITLFPMFLTDNCNTCPEELELHNMDKNSLSE